MLFSWIFVDPKNFISKQNFLKFDYLISLAYTNWLSDSHFAYADSLTVTDSHCQLPLQHHTDQLNGVYSGYILYVCSCGIEKYICH